MTIPQADLDAIAGAVWDELLKGSTHNIKTSAGRRLRGLQEAGGYVGRIWIDTLDGVDPITPEPFEDGTDSNPIDNMIDANTLAASLGIHHFHIAPGSTIILDASQNNQVFEGIGWILDLNGQDISGSIFIGATVSGIPSGVGTAQMFRDCELLSVSHLANTHIDESGIRGTQIMIEAGDIYFDRCHSDVAGADTWIFDFGSVGSTNLNIRHYSGGIQLENMGNTGTDAASIEGNGQIIEGTCVGGFVAVRGNFTTSGITNLTLVDDARIDIDQIAKGVWLDSKGILIEQILRNKLITDSDTGIMTLYDDGGNVLMTAQLYEDKDGIQTYRGKGAERRERLT
ncbi:MAG TPA: hypothetical protein ENI23_16020 [bacterium]|nr:hypothetical protein [bacterium]